jgi:hypothetical protein
MWTESIVPTFKYKAMKKKLITLAIVVGIISALLAGSVVYYVTAATSSSVASTTLEEGSLLSGYDYIFYREGSTYYRRDGVTGEVTSGMDFQALFQWAIDDLESSAGGNNYGGNIKIMPYAGFYDVDSSIYVGTVEYGRVSIEGSGQHQTWIRALGDYPVFYLNGSQGDNANGIRIANLRIRGGGYTNTNAHGIYMSWTHSCIIENIFIEGARDAIHIVRDWRSYFHNVKIYGASATEAEVYNGFVVEEVTKGASAAQNGFVINNLWIGSVVNIGMSLKSISGIKGNNIEIGLSGSYGMYIGGESAGKWGSHYNHFVNVLIDQSKNHGLYVAQSSGTAEDEKTHDIWFNGLWVGSTGTDPLANLHGVYLNDVYNIEIDGGMIVGNGGCGVYALNSEQIVVFNVNFKNNERGGTAAYDVHLDSTVESVIDGNIMELGPLGQVDNSVKESGTSDYNIISNNIVDMGIVTVGANTIAVDNINPP